MSDLRSIWIDRMDSLRHGMLSELKGMDPFGEGFDLRMEELRVMHEKVRALKEMVEVTKFVPRSLSMAGTYDDDFLDMIGSDVCEGTYWVVCIDRSCYEAIRIPKGSKRRASDAALGISRKIREGLEGKERLDLKDRKRLLFAEYMDWLMMKDV